jgi:large subunit ribosomal protein L4
LNINGTQLDSSNELKLNVLEASGNYLLHKDILRHFNSQRQGTVSTKTRSEVRGGGRKPWRQKVLVVPEPVLIVHLMERWWCNFGPKPRRYFKVK